MTSASRAMLLAAALMLSACGTTYPWQGESLLSEPQRSRIASQFANVAMTLHRCDKVDSITSRVTKTTNAVNGQGPLAPGDGSVAERWVLRLCGREVEADVYHGLDKNGHPVAALRVL